MAKKGVQRYLRLVVANSGLVAELFDDGFPIRKRVGLRADHSEPQAIPLRFCEVAGFSGERVEARSTIIAHVSAPLGVVDRDVRATANCRQSE